ncbi:MAG: sulfotransferase domain-containing protein [Desulforegulaceae bacterium]|nr:sulfotransferase domain-containing protein [Desulforegulaceae bacterium]
MIKPLSKLAIHSVPRSGSSWLGQIFNSSPLVKFVFQPLFSYAFKSFLNENSSKKQINDFFSQIAVSNDDFLLQNKNIGLGFYPKFNKQLCTFVAYKEVRYHHILKNMIEKAPDIKLVCLIRSPLSVIDDWLKTPLEFRRDLGWKEIDEWKFAEKKNHNLPEEFNGYEKWKETANIFEWLEKKHPNSVCIVEYKNLLKNTLSEAQRLFDFCGIELEDQTLDFLSKKEKKHIDDPYSVFKNIEEDSEWEKTLNKDIAKAILEDLQNSKLKKYL